MTQLTKQLIAVAGLIIIAFFLINRVFPEKKDVDPVRKQSVQIEKDTRNTNKGVITDDEVHDIKPIGDIPVIGMQSDQQQTDANTGVSGTIYQIEPVEYREVKPDSEEAEQIAEPVKPEPAEDIGVGTQSLNDYCEINIYLAKREEKPNTYYSCLTDDYGLPIRWIESYE